jgi:hypothetical protein
LLAPWHGAKAIRRIVFEEMLGVGMPVDVWTVGLFALALVVSVAILGVAFSGHQMMAKLAATVNGVTTDVTVSSVGNHAVAAQVAPDGGSALPVYGPLAWLPTWKQTGGVLPDGQPDPAQYNDCGETCVVMVIAAIKGVSMEPGAIRQMLGGWQRTGLTTGADLAQALQDCNISCAETTLGGADAFQQVKNHWGHAMPMIALGEWLNPGVLHWVLIWSWSPSFVGVIDPWTGEKRNIAQGDFIRLFRGSMVVVTEPCRYNMAKAAQPGFN